MPKRRDSKNSTMKTSEVMAFHKLFRNSSVKLSHIENFLESCGDLRKSSNHEREIALDSLTELQVDYDQLMDLLSKEDVSEDEFKSLSSKVGAFQVKIMGLRAKMLKFSEPKTAIPNTSNLSTTFSHNPKPRLPNLPIPKFSGNPGDWVTFKNTYTALIHDDPDLSGVVKFTYLLNALDDDTKSLLGAIILSDEGYVKAWENLLDCFDNKRKIIEHHIEILLNLPHVPRDNAKELRKLINTVKNNLSSLELCNHPLDLLSEQLLINIVLKRVDVSIRKEWENELLPTELTNWAQLSHFLTKKCRVLESIESLKPNTNQIQGSKPKPSGSMNIKSHKKQTVLVNTSAPQPSTSNIQRPNIRTQYQEGHKSCPICKRPNHAIHKCYEFLNLAPKNRVSIIAEIKHCINCLKAANHKLKDCGSSRCRICHEQHHTLVHEACVPNHLDSGQVHCLQNQEQVILPTAVIFIQDVKGRLHECRALLDSGSQANLITASFAQRLKIAPSNHTRLFTGVNQVRTQVREMISANILAKNKTFKRNIDLSIVEEISTGLPRLSFNISNWDIPKGVHLADPNLNVQRPVELLLGADIFFQILQANKIKLRQGPVLYKTIFGWIVGGTQLLDYQSFSLFETPQETTVDLQQSLSKLFDLDPVANKLVWTKEELDCEDFYVKTTFRGEDGRYVVSLPLRENVSKLGNSRQQALRRFLNLERKFDKNPEIKGEYSKVINEYLELGHMKEIDEDLDDPTLISFYSPHHAVIKPSSTTTKLRVVFDASAKSSSGLSLNDVLMVGPTIQQTSFEILNRFRCHKYVFTSDVTKMYRQIKIAPAQTSLQRILWRSAKDDSIRTYELNTVTFGTSSAPFLATRTLKQMALEQRQRFPLASKVTERDFYVDDCLTGSDDLQEALLTIQQLREMFSHSGFELRKWCSNSPQVLGAIPTDHLYSNEIFDNECIKTLGISWQPQRDTFRLNIPAFTLQEYFTKRIILSQLAQLYDPLGLMAPVLVSAKILIQDLWKAKGDWDDRVPPEIIDLWSEWISTLSELKTIEIKRRLVCDDPQEIEIHGFADASEKAYGACIYLRSVNANGQIFVNLVCSKTRVAPIKNISIPRLELCAALLLARLTETIVKALDLTLNAICLWSDSTVTLAWIQTEPFKLKTFIANRVSEIQELTNQYTWKHVPTQYNPADLISRGLTPTQFVSNQEWFNGPCILRECISEMNTDGLEPLDHTTLEFKPEYINFLTQSTKVIDTSHVPNFEFISELIERYNSYSKILRIIAHCLRVSRKVQRECKIQVGSFLTTGEMEGALSKIIISIQTHYFKDEISHLLKHDTLPHKCSILSLHPFLDKNKILRVGGRITNSDLGFEKKHPILIPANHHFTNLIFRHYHKLNLHAGPQLLLSLVRQKFWPIAGKNAAKKCVRSCVICFRNLPRINTQLMGDLPAARITPARTFQTTGIDYCGPILVKDKRIRTSREYKVYVAVFICFVTKAVHLEIVSDLTSEGFLACLKRFIYRRGKPATIWSDNATTFVGANNELNDIHSFLQEQRNADKILKFCTLEEISWKFIPPRSPNFGGLWESSVKSLKTHLKRCTTGSKCSFEELNTILIQIEGILNSRPLTVLSDDPSDPIPLTPSHFLCGTAIRAPIEPSFLEIPTNKLSHWQRVTQMVQFFWKRFSVEYLNTLQQRVKWKHKEPNLKIGDVVLIVDENSPPNQWLMGVILEVTRGSDNLIRVLKIKTKNGITTRGLSKVCKLPID